MSKLVTFGLLLAVVALGWAADHYYGKALDWRDTAHRYQQLAASQGDTIATMNERQRAVAALDEKYTRELADAQKTISDLRRDVNAGRRRMYVSAKCPVSVTAQTAGTGSLGDVAPVELSANAGRNVLDIRAGIISDQTKIKYLQDYIRQQCLAPKTAPQ